MSPPTVTPAPTRSAPPTVAIPDAEKLPFVNIEAATPAEPFDPTDNPPFAVTIPAAAS